VLSPSELRSYLPDALTADWSLWVAYTAALLAFVGAGDAVRRLLRLSDEVGRKTTHVLVGVSVAPAPLLFTAAPAPIAMGGFFVLVNSILLRTGAMKVRRRTFGTVLFPLAFSVLVALWWNNVPAFLAGILALTFADTAASIVGESIARPHFYVLAADRKSVEGSAAMFAVSFAVVWSVERLAGGGRLGPATTCALAAFVALYATLAEAASEAGSDNFSIPVIVAVAYDLFIRHAAEGRLDRLAVLTVGMGAAAALVLRTRSLTPGGAAGFFVMGTLLYGFGGWPLLGPMVVFFVLSSLISRLGGSGKKKLQDSIGKGSERDLYQVLANGGVAAVLGIAYGYTGYGWLYLGYLAAVAGATADTWATELGFFAKGNPRQILTFRRVEKGESGGMSALGTAASVAGGITIALAGGLLEPRLGARGVVMVAVAGLVGSFADSAAGAFLQARYRCERCGRSTEKLEHCGAPTRHEGGVRWIGNDLVNLLGTFAAGAAGLIAGANL